MITMFAGATLRQRRATPHEKKLSHVSSMESSSSTEAVASASRITNSNIKSTCTRGRVRTTTDGPHRMKKSQVNRDWIGSGLLLDRVWTGSNTLTPHQKYVRPATTAFCPFSFNENGQNPAIITSPTSSAKHPAQPGQLDLLPRLQLLYQLPQMK